MDLHDDAILAALRRIAATVDPVPPTVVEAARAAFLTRDLDTDIARLIADSRGDLEGEATAYEPARAGEDPVQGQWLLSFEGGGVHIDLEIEQNGADLRLLGLLSGSPVEECSLQTGDGTLPVGLDSLGRFVVGGLAHGPIRLRCRLSDGRRITTTWVRV